MPDETEEEFLDESIYGEESREEMVEGDGLSPKEEAFMKGYDEADNEPEKEVPEEEEEI